MIYKDFVAEAAQKIMAAAIADKNAESLNNDNESLAEYARGSVNAAKALADALDQDWQSTPVDSIHRSVRSPRFSSSNLFCFLPIASFV